MRFTMGMRGRGPRLVLAVFITAATGALGLIVSAGSAHADTAGSTCGGAGQPACPPSGSITGLPPASMGGAVIVTWPPNSLDLQKEQLVITWAPSTPTPSYLGAPTQTSVTLKDPASCLLNVCTYQWPSALTSTKGGYVFNGTYTLAASAEECILGLACSTPGTATPTSVAVANPPATPTGVTTTLTHNNSQVIVSWAQNPEPDIVGYEVFRSGQTTPVCSTKVSPSTSGLTCTDSPTKDGSYQYQVKAFRVGPTYQTTVESTDASPLTSAVKVINTATNATTTTTNAIIPPAINAQLAPGKASTPKLNAAPPGPAVALSPTAPTSVDPGFNPVLPYAQPQATDPGTTDPAVIAAPPIHKSATSVATVAAVGAGLLIAVIALHGLWLRSEVRRSGTLEVLDPDH